MKRGIKIAFMMLVIGCLSTQLVFAQFTKTKNRKYKLPDVPEKEVVKDKGVLDPDTLRFQFHSQKTGLKIDTGANLDLYYNMYEWLGTRYRFGGESKKGIDCSGFTGVMYENVYKRTLPRDSRSMYKLSKPISKEEMKEGDLVFFRIRRGQVSHVGIYLGNNKFVHSATSSGVIISDLREDYYRRYFFKAGRLKSPTEVIEEVRD